MVTKTVNEINPCNFRTYTKLTKYGFFNLKTIKSFSENVFTFNNFYPRREYTAPEEDTKPSPKLCIFSWGFWPITPVSDITGTWTLIWDIEDTLTFTFDQKLYFSHSGQTTWITKLGWRWSENFAFWVCSTRPAGLLRWPLKLLWTKVNIRQAPHFRGLSPGTLYKPSAFSGLTFRVLAALWTDLLGWMTAQCDRPSSQHDWQPWKTWPAMEFCCTQSFPLRCCALHKGRPVKYWTFDPLPPL